MVVFNIIFAILSFICAGLCIWNPFTSAVYLGYMIAAFMGVWGIMAIISYFASKRKNARVTTFEAVMGVFGLIMGIIGLLFFVFSVAIPGFTFTIEEFCVVLLMIFLAVEGVMLVISSIANARLHGTFITVLGVFVGIIMVVGGILGIMNIPFVLSIFGIMLGIAFAINGIRLLIYCIE